VALPVLGGGPKEPKVLKVKPASAP
jgi:hypothetical protein